MLFRFLGILFVVAGLAVTGYNDITKPEIRAGALQSSFLNATLSAAGVRQKPNAAQLLLAVNVIGAFLLGASALVLFNVLRSVAAFLLAVFVAANFFIMYVDVRKPITGIPRGQETKFFADLILIGALLIISTLRSSIPNRRDVPKQPRRSN